MPLQGDLAVERMCQLAQVGRAGFYRYLQCGWQGEEEVAVRSAVQSVVIGHRWRYGYRRVTAELRAQGMIVNHKRIARIMREDNLLTVQRDWLRPADHSLREGSERSPGARGRSPITHSRRSSDFVCDACQRLARALDCGSRMFLSRRWRNSWAGAGRN